MIYVGTQYYRPPFPESRYWEQDMKGMADAGLNAVQLWVVWAWVEAKEGEYRYDDYDRIVELAGKHGLSVVLSTIAAIHPYWIHRSEPGSEMVDNAGHRVVSSNRGECHYGLTPGGCFDHQGVWRRMRDFIQATGRHYSGVEAVVAWDAWNELRWNVQADGLVCYCANTLERYRRWLEERYGGLGGLNEAWKRRYPNWEDVLPGKRPDRPYTDMMAFQRFTNWRSVEHAWKRYEALKEVAPDRDVTVHGGQPTVLHGYDSYPTATCLHRGNDWDFAEKVDGVGCSSFPLWGGREMSPVDVHNRFEYLRSAAGKKKIWLSELQGGRYNIGFHVGQSVDGVRQQRWIWNGYAIGAEKVLFWCWRDEVFGRESNGFGFAGNDGLAAERIAAMRRTGALIREHAEILQGYRPDPAPVGLLFSPESCYLYWSQEETGARVIDSLRGYANALTGSHIPFEVIEERHLDRLAEVSILFAPRVGCMSHETSRALLDWVEKGGRLVLETETGAFTPEGFYRYPEDRPFVAATGIHEVGRRMLQARAVELAAGDQHFELAVDDWLSPMLSAGSEEEQIQLGSAVGTGRIEFVGTFLGSAALGAGDEQREAFRGWLAALVDAAGIQPPVTTSEQGRFPFFAKVGSSGESRLAFLFLPDAEKRCEVSFAEGVFPDGKARELVTDSTVTVRGGVVKVPATPWGVAVLAG
jgi:beta-galactosidase